MSKILALDQSSHITGYAVFNDGKLEAYGKFNITDSDLGERLYKIRNKVKELVKEYCVDEVVFEDIQLQENVRNNVQTFKALAEVIGVIYELMVEMNIPCTAVLASSWKSTLGIRGSARPEQKRNAQKYVNTTFNIQATQDECDAICIGSHYIKKNQTFNWD